MAEKDKNKQFTLEVPLDASGIKDRKEQSLKVVAQDRKGATQEQTVKLGSSGKGSATFIFTGHPGSLHVVVGPHTANAEELLGLQTIAVDVSARNWGESTKLEISPIIISPYYWWWWLWWCRDFTITGRVVCPDGSPVPGATVCAYDLDWWWWWLSEEQVGCATTDATGSFEIRFRWCCGWWPWWWWSRRIWRLEQGLIDRITPVLHRELRLPRIPIPDPKPDFAPFQDILGVQELAVAPTSAGIEPGALDRLRDQLLKRLPPAAELAQLHVWPWWPWHPWWDCTPDIIFKVTQNCQGKDAVIVNEGFANVRWDIPTNLNVTLVANQDACCIRTCHNPKECPDGDCIVITEVCNDVIAAIGGNPGAPANPAGFLSPGAVSIYGDRPYAGVITIAGKFGTGASADYYEFEWSNNGGMTWNAMPPAAAGGFTRVYWDGIWHSVPFGFSNISGHNVIESREHYEHTHAPGTWGITHFWASSTEDLLMNWLTDGTFSDGTYQLRVRSWSLVAANLVNPRILPLCDTQHDNGLVLTIDNRVIVNPAAHPHPCGAGTVHICTTEPDTNITAVLINGHPVGACAIVDAKSGGVLEIDFIAHDPDGHLAMYSLQANYGVNLAIDLLSAPGATLAPAPPVGAVPSALQVGPTYAAARTLPQTAVAPIWNGGSIRLTIPDLRNAFPESCCYQLELRAHKRTVVNCDHSIWGHTNLTEYSFTVIV